MTSLWTINLHNKISERSAFAGLRYFGFGELRQTGGK
jgi:hypothetical protein